MSSLTAATWRAFLCMFAAEVSLHRDMAILRTLVLILFQSLLYSVAIDLDDLLTLSLTLRGIEIMDVSIPRSVGKAHLVTHAVFELISFLQTFIKLFKIARQVLLIETRRSNIFLSSALLLFFPFNFSIAKCCSFILLLASV